MLFSNVITVHYLRNAVKKERNIERNKTRGHYANVSPETLQTFKMAGLKTKN